MPNIVIHGYSAEVAQDVKSYILAELKNVDYVDDIVVTYGHPICTALVSDKSDPYLEIRATQEFLEKHLTRMIELLAPMRKHYGIEVTPLLAYYPPNK